MEMPDSGARRLRMVEVSKPRPADRPDLDVEYRILEPDDWGGDESILVKIHYVDDLLPEDVTTVRGIPTTSPERTLLDLATCVSDAELRVAVATALARRLTTRAELHRAIARHPRHRGSPRLRALLRDA